LILDKMMMMMIREDVKLSLEVWMNTKRRESKMEQSKMERSKMEQYMTRGERVTA